MQNKGWIECNQWSRVLRAAAGTRRYLAAVYRDERLLDANDSTVLSILAAVHFVYTDRIELSRLYRASPTATLWVSADIGAEGLLKIRAISNLEPIAAREPLVSVCPAAVERGSHDAH